MLMRHAFVSIVIMCTSVTHAQVVIPEDAEAREGRPEPSREFTSPDKWFKASVPAKPGEVRKAGNSYVITLDVGSETPIVCEVTPAGIKLADTLRRGFDTWLKETGSGQGQDSKPVIESTDAGALGDVPFLAIRWWYGSGALKQLVFTKLGHGVYCSHRGVGYVKTFETVTRSLAESFKARAAEAAPYFIEIKTASVLGITLGIAVSTLQREASVGVQARQSLALLMPIPGGLHAHDADNVTQLRSDGSLVKEAHILLRDGVPAINIELALRESRWRIEGELEGHKLSETLPIGAKPGNWVEQARAMRKILAQENPIGAEHSLPMWTPSRPAELVDMHTKVLAKTSGDEFSAQIRLPRFESNAVLDRATGMTTSAEIPRGEQTIHMVRVHVRGTLEQAPIANDHSITYHNIHYA